jgi:hypothetical protein
MAPVQAAPSSWGRFDLELLDHHRERRVGVDLAAANRGRETEMSDDNVFHNRRLGVICCGHIFRREREVRLVVRECDGWQFVCGGTDHVGADGKPDGNYVHVRHLVNFDPSLNRLADLPPEWEAERKDATSAWIRTRRVISDP